jgi:hypothetical protein
MASSTSISATTINPTLTSSNDKELRINTPAKFKGDRTKLRKYIQDCKIYLAINRRLYTDNESKSAFILSYMEGGEADAWKEQYVSSITNPTTGVINFETIEELIKKLSESFNESQQKENALHRLTQLKQGKGAVEEHNIEFNLVRDQAGLNDNDNHMLIDVYKKSINPGIARKIIEALDKPKDLKEWMEKAAAYDNHWRQANDYLRVANPGRNLNQRRRFNFAPRRQERDPDAMDMDALTLEQHSELMRKGLCFRCKKPGHISKDCPTKNNYQSYNHGKNSEAPVQKTKMNARELYTHIQSLTKENLSKEQKTELYGMMDDNQGF